MRYAGCERARLRGFAMLAAALAIMALTPRNGAAQDSYVQIHTFCSQNNCADGGHPWSGLIADGSGNLYGTTQDGGANNSGTVFELTPNPSGGWTETVLYNFCSQSNCTDGAIPYAGLFMDGSGNLYGTTWGGGRVVDACPGDTLGCGVAFELTPTNSGWTETVLYAFCHAVNCGDGSNPSTGLVMDKSGNLYGVTGWGGINDCTFGFGCGIAFELAPNGQGWTETVIHSFCSQNFCGDGAAPAGLIIDESGNLYGTTASGGTINGNGTVFELTLKSAKWTETVLYAFCPTGSGCTDGSFPEAGPIMDEAGNLYGTTFDSGENGAGSGTVFELMPNGSGGWTETVLYRFCSRNGCADGVNPHGSLVMDQAGNLYGTTLGGGSNSNQGETGVVFRLTPNPSGGWTETVLYNFCSQGGSNCSDGKSPESSLIIDRDGNLYGTAFDGANPSCGGGCGTVFELIQRPSLVYAKGADFNGDGKGDILWRCTDTTSAACPDGQLAIWLMNGAALLSSLSPGQVPDAWQVAGTADGTTDILWQYSDGTLAIWEMAGGQILASLGPGQVPTAWALLE